MGAQLRIYRQKIKSAQTTKKITRAMELISASRIQKAQTRMNSAAPYTKALTRAVTAVAVGSNVDHPLTTQVETPRRAAVVVFTSDRGLAGAFSSQVLRETGELAEKLTSEGKEVVYYLVGRKSVSYFAFRQRKWERDWIGGTDRPEVETAQEISAAIIEHFLKPYDEGGVDEIHLVYNRFVNLWGMTYVEHNPDSWEGWYWGAVHHWGYTLRVGQSETYGTVEDCLQNCDMIVFWAADPETTSGSYGAQEGTVRRQWLKNPKLAISPAYHQCGRRSCVRPGSGARW